VEVGVLPSRWGCCRQGEGVAVEAETSPWLA
jgi:hypothetical protein